MKPALREIWRFNILWLHKPRCSYTGRYCGKIITVRYARGCKVGSRWRLSVTERGGGNLAFKHQFYPTVKAAMMAGTQYAEGVLPK